MVSRPPLGRGLASLLPTVAQGSALQDLSIDQITPDANQPRKAFDEAALQELALSIARHGIIQPLIVRKENNTYVLVAGERRWRAARIAGLGRVPAVLREPAGSTSFELALVENLQRQDLNPIDEALAYQHLRDAKTHSAAEIAASVGKSRSHVANMLRLLDLPAEAIKAISVSVISPGHGRAILMVPAHEERAPFFERLVREGWSVRRAEREARAYKPAKKNQPNPPNSLEPYYSQISSELSSGLGLEIKIRARNNKGVLEIPFENLDALKAISAKLVAATSRDRQEAEK